MDYSFRLIYYKNPLLKGKKYICDEKDLNNVYISEIFLDHYPHYPQFLEDKVTFNLCQLYQMGLKTRWSHHLTQNTLYSLHGLKL